MSDPVRLMLDAIALDPADDAAWLALADCLEDEGRPAEAEVARLREGLRRMAPDDPRRPADERRMQGLLAAGVRPVSPSLTLTLPHGVPVELRLIPPGTFWMGSPADEPGRLDNEALPHPVTVERGFWLAATPLTRRQAFVSCPLTDRPDEPASGGTGGDGHCRELSQAWGRRVRLPSEAEWEYACRAGTTSACHGGVLLSLPLVGWCSYGEHARTRGGLRPVRQLVPNAWGLYDLHGGVGEWTSERIGLGELRVIRGGCHTALPTRCRSASRYLQNVRHASPATGLRHALDLE